MYVTKANYRKCCRFEHLVGELMIDASDKSCCDLYSAQMKQLQVRGVLSRLQSSAPVLEQCSMSPLHTGCWHAPLHAVPA